MMSEIDDTSVAADTALVSVIMPTYAGDSLRHLEQAVQSVQAQTHDHFEFLIVLDGPVRRDTQSFLDRITLHDDRIQVLPRLMNEGPAAARNHAIDRAVGDYIAMLDAHDVALPDRLEKQLAFLTQCGADVVGAFARSIDADGKALRDLKRPETSSGIRNRFRVANPILNSTAFARAAVLKEDRYPESHRYAEDYELWIRLARRGRVLCNQNLCLANIRYGEPPTGWRPFQRELLCKLHALPLYPLYLAPIAVALMTTSSMRRLIP